MSENENKSLEKKIYLIEKSYRSPYGFTKPAARRLHAEVPCNYLIGRLAAALQSVFEIRKTPSRFFQINLIFSIPFSIFFNNQLDVMVGGVIEGKLLYLGRDLYYYGDMDYSYVLHSAMPLVEKFQAFGFEKTGDEYVCTKSIEVDGSGFDVIITCRPATSLTAQVFDKGTGDKYSLFDMPSARGAFIGKMREQVQKIIDEFRATCFIEQDLHEKYISYLASHYGVQPDFPWDDSPDACVFRCPNQKWFALMMKIKYKQLGVGSSDEDVWVVNMKHDADNIPSVVDKHSIFPAWHMNKKHWITVLLTAVTDFEKLCELTQRSFEMVSGKK